MHWRWRWSLKESHLLRSLAQEGVRQASHAGFVCDEPLKGSGRVHQVVGEVVCQVAEQQVYLIEPICRLSLRILLAHALRHCHLARSIAMVVIGS